MTSVQRPTEPPISDAAAEKNEAAASSVQIAGYPAGHLGHLNDDQQASLVDFKALLTEKKLLKPGPPPSHNDQTLIRFLRARSWVVDEAYKQFKEAEEWRATHCINCIYETFDRDVYEKAHLFSPQWTGKTDRRGIPICVFEITRLNNKEIAEIDKKGSSLTFCKVKADGSITNSNLQLFGLIEHLLQFTHPFCSQLSDHKYAGVPITSAIFLVDLSGMGLRQFWNLKYFLQVAATSISQHYPELIDHIIITGAPSFFSILWGWLKSWFDPGTVKKIIVASDNELQSILESLMDPKDIPTKYGGKVDHDFTKLTISSPDWDGFVQWENGHTAFPVAPMVWEDEAGGERMAAIAVGTKNGEHRRDRVCTIPKTFKQN